VLSLDMSRIKVLLGLAFGLVFLPRVALAVDLPDLVVTVIADPPAVAGQGDSFDVQNTVMNRGSIAAGQSTTKYSLVSTADGTSKDLKGPIDGVPKLDPGESFAETERVTIRPETVPGLYRLRACADGNKVVPELNDNNNCATSAGTIQVVETPDLAVVSVTVQPPLTVPLKSPLVVSTVVKNQGRAAAPASTLKLTLVNTVTGARKNLRGTLVVPALAVGASATVASTTDVTVPSNTPPGTYTVQTCADSDKVVDEIVESNNCGNAPETVTVVCVNCPHDFNGDGKVDILWRNTTSGVVAAWFMSGLKIVGGAVSPDTVGPDWTIQGVADFNGDGKADILWRHTSGLVAIWLMDGLTVIDAAFPGTVGLDWTIQGVGDFNGDGKADILWRHTSGSLFMWLMDGPNIIGAASPGTESLDWTIQGVGDFNGDGKADILWRHTSGLVAIWFMNGFTTIGTDFPGTASLDWTIQGVADFNGDRTADILWRDAAGVVAIWLMSGATIIGADSPGPVGLDWTIQAVGDFNGDGKADIVWRDTAGVVAIWLMNGATIIGAGSPGPVGLDWAIQR